jgi:hypothetical protein
VQETRSRPGAGFQRPSLFVAASAEIVHFRRPTSTAQTRSRAMSAANGLLPRLFVGQQLQKHLPLGVTAGFSKPPPENDQIFGA